MKRAIASVFAAAILTSGAAFSESGACPSLDGHWGWGGSYSVQVADGLALFDSGPTLLVADWTEPSAPRLLGKVRLSGEPRGIAVDDDLAVVAVTDFGLEVVDISNAESPRVIGQWRSEDSPTAVAADAGLAFVTDMRSTLRVIDLADPEQPVEVGSLVISPPSGAHDVDLSSGFAFVAAGYTMVVVDVTDPTQPSEVAWVSVSGFSPNLSVDESTIWLLGSAEPELTAIDISDPLAPTIIGGLNLPGLVRDVDATGGVVHVAAFSSGLHVVDAADPTQPTLAATLEIPGWAWAVSSAPWGALVATGHEGVAAVETVALSFPSIEGDWIPPAPMADVSDAAAKGNLLVLADWSCGNGRVWVLDASDPRRPIALGWTELPADGWAIDLLPGIAVVAHTTIDVDIPVDGGITVVDLADPTAPVLLATWDLPGYVTDVVAAGWVAFAINDGDIVVIDLTVPTEPEEVARWEPELVFLESVDVDTGIVFAGGSSGELCAADVAVPSAPVHLGCQQVAGYEDSLISLDVRGPLAVAVADPGPGAPDQLLLLDVSDPAHPDLLAVVPATGADGDLTAAEVLLTGSLAAVSLGPSNGVQLFDVSDPTAPTAIGESHSPNYSSHGMTTAGGRLFVAAGFGGLDSYRLDACRRPRLPGGRRPLTTAEE